MSSRSAPARFFPTRFRASLLVAMMVIAATITGVGVFFAERDLAAGVERDLQRQFEGELATLHHVQELRHAALLERCRALVRRPRIHAALEDDATDLLYPSAKDELRDLMRAPGESPAEQTAYALHAEFYRFLDRHGAVIAPPNSRDVGPLRSSEEKQLALPRAPDGPQLGYLSRKMDRTRTAMSELIAMPIVSSETGEVIAALVLGFKPIELAGERVAAGIKAGLWSEGQLQLAGLSPEAHAALAREVTAAIRSDPSENRLETEIAGVPYLVFYKQINPGSLYAAAHEVFVYPLTELRTRQQQLRWRVVGAGALLLLSGLVASHILSRRLSAPVEKLAVDSEEQRAQRERAEAALETTHVELQRSVRFSADASHQLKTPVTVLRAGLEELLAQENLTPATREEVAALVHQTFRLTSVIEDLLLLSRMDAGRLKLELAPVNLSHLIEAALDDLGALHDAPALAIETEFPAVLQVAGEKRYTSLILQNLLENARKYNRADGRIRVVARIEGEMAVLTIANTGRPISAAARQHIFERFHRGTMGENIPGHGLGLNLARELARLHGGDLRLVRSDEEWTEFEVRFRVILGSVSASKVI